MKCIWLKFLIISFIWGQETHYDRSGDPNDLSFPGGYIGISYQIDLKSKQKGYQISFGIAVPGVGKSGNGPYFIPGIALGRRHLAKENKSYTYIDSQMVFSSGVWGGVGFGIAFVDGKRHLRTKQFGGFLVGGFVNENIDTSDLDWEDYAFKAYHLGFAFPIIGNHLYP